MYQYHGWFSTFELDYAEGIENKIKEINTPYPASAVYVNGGFYISFSGSLTKVFKKSLGGKYGENIRTKMSEPN